MHDSLGRKGSLGFDSGAGKNQQEPLTRDDVRRILLSARASMHFFNLATSDIDRVLEALGINVSVLPQHDHSNVGSGSAQPNQVSGQVG